MAGDAANREAVLIGEMRRAGRLAHDAVLRLAEDLTDEQLARRTGPLAPPIAFHVWHLARWADWDTHQFGGVPQIWHERGLAAAWGFPVALGENDSGTELDDEAAARLTFPANDALLDYTRAAFGAVDQMLDRLADEAVQGIEGRSVGDDQLISLLNTYLMHENRHLGMIEALRGVMGIRGTATR